MAAMSQHQGFTISQPALGAALQFYPALGTAELDILIDSYVPGVASVKDKRTQVTMEFFRHAEQTGQFIKFFPVFTFDPLTAESPASFYDSGYGSGFHASPVVPDMTWAQPAQFIPSSQSQASVASSSRRPSAERKASSAKGTTGDFSHIPGMKILTKDGVDVTNSASRGCKTKEQRDHAHLMRIIKACDSCKKKKIRCDPSHKKRPASQSSSPEAKPAKKSKKAPPASTPRKAQQIPSAGGFDLFADISPLDLDVTASMAPNAEPLAELEQDWEQFFQYNDPVVAVPEYDFALDPAGYLSSPSSGPSDFSPQPFTPSTDTSGSTPDLQRPTLPYLTTGAHGSNYVDFSLYESQQPFPVVDATESGWSPPGGEDLGSGVGSWCQHNPSPPPGTHPLSLPQSAVSSQGLKRGEDNSHTSLQGLNSGLGQSTALNRSRISTTGIASYNESDLFGINANTFDGSGLTSPASSADFLGRQSTVSASRSPSSSDDPGISRRAPSATAQVATGLQTPQADLWGDGLSQLASPAIDHSQGGHATGDGCDRLDRNSSSTVSCQLTSLKRKTTTTEQASQTPQTAISAKVSKALPRLSGTTTAIATSSSQSEAFSVVPSLAPARSRSSTLEKSTTTTALVNRTPRSIGSRHETQERWATNAPFTALADQQLQQASSAACSPGLAVETQQAGYSRAEEQNAAAGVFLATLLLLTLPFRQIVEGPFSQTRKSSSLFVGLGLFSVISSVILHASSSDTLQKLAIIPLSLVLVLQHLTSRPSDDSAVRKAPFKDAIDNVKSKIQDVSRIFGIV